MVGQFQFTRVTVPANEKRDYLSFIFVLGATMKDIEYIHYSSRTSGGQSSFHILLNISHSQSPQETGRLKVVAHCECKPYYLDHSNFNQRMLVYHIRNSISWLAKMKNETPSSHHLVQHNTHGGPRNFSMRQVTQRFVSDCLIIFVHLACRGFPFICVASHVTGWVAVHDKHKQNVTRNEGE